MKQIVVDTDIIIDFLRRIEPAKNVIDEISEEKCIAFISMLTEAEVLSGKECENLQKRKDAEDVLLLMNKAEVTSEIAKKAAEFRRAYGISLIDAVIAATAFKLNAPLYSRNARHFSKIKEIRVEKPY